MREGFAPYEATLLEWTLDPGVGKFQCSDGQVRLIPCCALDPYREWVKPDNAPQNYSPILYVGEPSQS